MAVSLLAYTWNIWRRNENKKLTGAINYEIHDMEEKTAKRKHTALSCARCATAHNSDDVNGLADSIGVNYLLHFEKPMP